MDNPYQESDFCITEQGRKYSLIPPQNANDLKTAEMGLEQNYNQIDGIINNEEPPSVNQSYITSDSQKEREYLEDCRPSILSQLKADTTRTPEQEHKKTLPNDRGL